MRNLSTPRDWRWSLTSQLLTGIHKAPCSHPSLGLLRGERSFPHSVMRCERNCREMFAQWRQQHLAWKRAVLGTHHSAGFPAPACWPGPPCYSPFPPLCLALCWAQAGSTQPTVHWAHIPGRSQEQGCAPGARPAEAPNRQRVRSPRILAISLPGAGSFPDDKQPGTQILSCICSPLSNQASTTPK